LSRFNPRARVGRDWGIWGTLQKVSSFNPRARVGRDTSVSPRWISIPGFNPRARVGRDVVFPVLLSSFPQFQSTRPRGARPEITFAEEPKEEVSIHAPAWGATQELQLHALKGKVSIHAPAWGATVIKRLASASFYVSIHAPAWGATCLLARSLTMFASFNPRARVGRDFVYTHTKLYHLMFQSTRPRGARPPTVLNDCKASAVSIHAPAWGATCAIVHGKL